MLSSNSRRLLVSLISSPPSQLFKNLRAYEEIGIDGIHFDVMDGLFVPRLGLYPELLAEIRQSTSLFIEVHCMLSNPVPFLESFIQAGANRIVFHAETQTNLSTLLELTASRGIEVGVALNPSTQVKAISPYLTLVNTVMLMAIQPGIPKHPFIEDTFSKLEELRKMADSLQLAELAISIDGGVTFDNLSKLFLLGANELICGSGTVFHPSGDLVQNLKRAKSLTLK